MWKCDLQGGFAVYSRAVLMLHYTSTVGRDTTAKADLELSISSQQAC